MNIELVGWHDEHFLDHRRRLRNAMLVSLALHASLFAVMVIESSPTLAPMPEFISIELLAAPPTTSRPARPKPAVAPTPPPAAEPAPPEPAPPAPPPVTKAPVQVLPEESPGRILEARPEPKPVLRRPVRERELSYEEAMAALDDELGVDETVDLLRPAPAPVEPEDSGAIGRRVSFELVAWSRAVQRLIRNKWVTPSNFRNRGLATSLEFRLSATGAVIGNPIVVRSSGDPFFDDNAVRALLTVAPLPPPPEPGLQVFIFNAEGN